MLYSSVELLDLMKPIGLVQMDYLLTPKVQSIRYVVIICRNNQMANIARINFIDLVNEYIFLIHCIILQMTEQGDLIVRNLTFDDMGNFQCLVKNLNGSDKIETFVYPLATS